MFEPKQSWSSKVFSGLTAKFCCFTGSFSAWCPTWRLFSKHAPFTFFWISWKTFSLKSEFRVVVCSWRRAGGWRRRPADHSEASRCHAWPGSVGRSPVTSGCHVFSWSLWRLEPPCLVTVEVYRGRSPIFKVFPARRTVWTPESSLLKPPEARWVLGCRADPKLWHQNNESVSSDCRAALLLFQMFKSPHEMFFSVASFRTFSFCRLGPESSWLGSVRLTSPPFAAACCIRCRQPQCCLVFEGGGCHRHHRAPQIGRARPLTG